MSASGSYNRRSPSGNRCLLPPLHFDISAVQNFSFHLAVLIRQGRHQPERLATLDDIGITQIRTLFSTSGVKRLGIPQIAVPGFCALKLVQRFPSRLPFGKFKGRLYRAAQDAEFRSWLAEEAREMSF